MPVTAPDTVTYRSLSVALIDDSGDKRSVSLRILPAATGAEIEAFVDALGAASSANVYEYSVSDVHAAAPSAAAALDGEQNSVWENVVILFKDIASGQTQNVFIPAPLETLMVDDTDSVDTSDALYTAVRAAADDILPAGFAPITVRYTERREINDSRSPA